MAKEKKKKKSKMAICGIYSIINKINGKMYIGQSIDIKKRWSKHKMPSTWKDLPTIALYRAFVKYGIDNFEFKIEEIVDEYDLNEYDKKEIVFLYAETLNSLEVSYIKKYDTYSKGYNMTRGNVPLNKYIPPAYYTKEYRPNLMECRVNDKYALYDEKEGVVFIDTYDLSDETWDEKSLEEILCEVNNYLYYLEMSVEGDIDPFSQIPDVERYEKWALANDPYYK